MIGFGAGGAATPVGPPAAGVKAAIDRRALNTSTGNQDITIGGFGTPKLAVFVLSYATADATVKDHAVGSIGAYDGTNQWVAAWTSEHGQGASDITMRGTDDEVLMALDPAGNTPLIEADAVAFIQDGVRINIGATNGVALLLTTHLFGGEDLSAACGTQILANTASATVTPGFETDALILMHLHTIHWDDITSESSSTVNLGFASWDGVTIRQCYNAYTSLDAKGTTDVQARVDTDQIMGFVSSGRAALENITSTAFDITTIDDRTDTEVGWVALNLGAGGEAWAGVVDTPTATGEHTFTEPGIEPFCALFGMNSVTSTDTQHTTGGNTGIWGLAGMTATEEFSNGWGDDDAEANSDTHSWSDDRAISVQNSAGSGLFMAGDFVEMTANGPKIDITTADGTVRKWPLLVLAA